MYYLMNKDRVVANLDVKPATELRVKCLEEIVRRQAGAILSHNKLYTKDAFFSQKALEAEQNKEKGG